MVESAGLYVRHCIRDHTVAVDDIGISEQQPVAACGVRPQFQGVYLAEPALGQDAVVDHPCVLMTRDQLVDDHPGCVG